MALGLARSFQKLDMRKLLYPGFLVVCVAFGYFSRGAFGNVALYLVGGMVVFVAIHKLAQIGLLRYVKIQGAKMSPQEREEFEEYQKSVDEEKA
jgi:hypothetical protein